MAPSNIILNRTKAILIEYPCIADAPASPAGPLSMRFPPLILALHPDNYSIRRRQQPRGTCVGCPSIASANHRG